MDRVVQAPVDGLAHYDGLEFVYAIDASKRLGKEADPLIGEQRLGDDGNGRMSGNLCKGPDRLLVTIRTNGFEL